MAMTDAEKQEIIDGLLAEIRANGLDYSGQTITFPDAFNITQTERQNVKIPAIDERSSTPVHGNVDLEALLTAYGVTHVEDIASDISSNYMKKIADSNLNMNGKIITNLLTFQSNILGGVDSSKISIIPVYTRAVLGLTGSEEFSYMLRTVLKKICEDFPDCHYHIFIGRCAFAGTGTFITMINGTSTIDSEGYPTNSQGIYFRDLGEMYVVRTYNGIYSFSRISAYDASNTAVDNRINSASLDAINGYIRYENGLQICWGIKSLSSVEYNQALGSIYQGTQTNPITFPQPFISNPSVSIDNTGGYGWIGRILATTTGVTEIMRYAHASGSYNGHISYIAIGAWK